MPGSKSYDLVVVGGGLEQGGARLRAQDYGIVRMVTGWLREFFLESGGCEADPGVSIARGGPHASARFAAERTGHSAGSKFEGAVLCRGGSLERLISFGTKFHVFNVALKQFTQGGDTLTFFETSFGECVSRLRASKHQKGRL